MSSYLLLARIKLRENSGQR